MQWIKEASSINGAVFTGGLQVGELDLCLSSCTKLMYTCIQGLQHKTRYSKSNSRESEKNRDLIDTWENFL